jgi:F-type H+-transporting ATPase subunit b
MDEILRQLGGLLLGAVPTVVLFILLYIAYRNIVHNRLKDVLAERRARTDGAIEKARADVAAADAKTADYEQRLRDAKLALYKAQEQRRQQALERRAKNVAEARAAADAQVRAAKQAMEQDVTAAKGSLQSEAEALANQVIRIILKPVSASATGQQ